ncbi:Ef-Hand Calcium-Binding Domain-Containing Protein 13 [Manis pentadactyla]|nr:Ef-Hand Calcium-Binding Domain-Containing Protein 13 [Manis pentadactyla]
MTLQPLRTKNRALGRRHPSPSLAFPPGKSFEELWPEGRDALGIQSTREAWQIPRFLGIAGGVRTEVTAPGEVQKHIFNLRHHRDHSKPVSTV